MLRWLGLGEEGFVEQLCLRKKAGIELREYQVQAAKNVLQKGNSLVVMPTALGKTFVAVLVIARLLYDQRRGRTPDGKFLFLVPTKPLALQQARRLRELLDVDRSDVVVLSGEIAPKDRAGVWAGARIVVATPQTVSHDLPKKRLDLRDFVLVVFDEAHRAVKEYAYSKIAKQAQGNSKTLLLGLTASPSADKEKVAEICSNLAVKHIEIKTDKDYDVADFVKKVRTDFVFVDLPQEFLNLRSFLEALLSGPVSDLRNSGFLPPMKKPSKRHLLEARSKILKAASRGGKSAYWFMSVQARAFNILHSIDLLESQGTKALLQFFHDMRSRKVQSKAVKALLADSRFAKVEKAAQKLVEAGLDHPKKEKLFEIVGTAVREGKTTIVFAHFRASSKEICNALNELEGVKAVQFVGRSGAEGMTQKKQAEVLDKFREGEFNVLVATLIGEEGLDVPSVDLVVFYETVPSEIRLIQRRGRAGRVKSGNVIVLVAKDTKDEAFLWISRKKERKMHRHLKSLKETLTEGEEVGVESVGLLPEEVVGKPVDELKEKRVGRTRGKAKQRKLGEF
ncbi:MAG: DEAD/DEAH box helicase [Candidatus Micrarchaeia archaeon]